MIIDCHTHLNHYEDETCEALPICLERLQNAMRRNRIDQALILTSYKVSPGRPSARAVVEATRHLPNLHVIAGISWTTFSQADVDELRDLLQARAIKGLKLYPGYEPFYPADPKLLPAYQLAEEFDVPVMIHSGDTFSPKGKLKYAHPLEIDEVAVDHPNVKFVICHLGNPWLTDAMEVVYKNANVYADISGLMLGEFTQAFEDYMNDEIEDVITYAGEPEKFLYGTDWPICSMRSYLEFVRRLEIKEADRHLLLYENARRLFKLPLPAASPS